MSTVRRKHYSIHRVRLVNFHNIQNEIINIHHGGHLFLLGDNGSGKTTVLDAIHYVLTAGELVEFNSAARVVGQRNEGRRLQGIIMRFNTETGPLNPQGGVTYAVLELHDEKGNILSVGLGMSCRSMEEQLQRWGFIEPRPLEDLPILIEDGEGVRARDRGELKEVLEATGGFYNIGPFRREITTRLFHNADVFNDICRLLRMGKAYREIVAQSNDYHELFMRLMPEPKTEIFERVIDSLHSLEESKSVLEDFERKQRYVKELESLRSKIHSTREKLIRLDWLEKNLTIEERSAALLGEEKRLGELQINLKEIEEARATHVAARNRARKKLDDLKTSDREGLVSREKECTAEIANIGKQKAELSDRVKTRRQEQAQLEKSLGADRNNLRKLIRDAGQHLARVAPSLPFPTTELAAELDHLYRAEEPENEASSLGIHDSAEKARTEIIRLERESTLLEKEENELNAEMDKRTKAIARSESERTILPSLRHFPEACRLLRQNMISVFPLYEGLEWKAGVTLSQKALVEELFGPRVLGTLMVDEDNYETGRNLLVCNYPHLRVTHPGLGAETLPHWFKTTFDLQTSHPHSLACLAAQMISRGDPEFTEIQGYKVVGFRGHQRRMAAPNARLIGTESRKKALAREVKDQQKVLKEVNTRHKEISRQANQLREQLEVLTRFDRFLEETQSAFMTQVPTIKSHLLNAEHIQGALADGEKRLNQMEADLTHLNERRDNARKLISKEGLVNLDQQVDEASARVAEIEEKLAVLDQRKGGLNSELEAARLRMAALEQTQEEALVSLDEIGKHLLLYNEEITDLEDHILQTHKGYRYQTASDIAKARTKAGDLVVETRTLLRTKMSDPSLGATFSFVYDEEHNALMDRRGRAIAELVASQRKTIDDQRQVVNEETFMLFKEIIMKELIGELRKMVFDLEEMSRNINELLSKRAFGNNRYRFSLRAKPNYKHLVNIIHSIDRFDSEPEKELRDFFEDHKDEIVNTEAGEIPDLLDYRNWYHFEMQVMREREDGKLSDRVVMNRRIKGLGSGGEQAVPNYLLVLTIAHFLFKAGKTRMYPLLFDEAFYGIDANRRDQLLGFASDLDLQLFVASPDQDGVKKEIDFSTTLLIVKDINYNVSTYKFDWRNPAIPKQTDLFEKDQEKPLEFEESNS